MAYEDLILGFRFGVFFFAGGIIPNPIDIRFKRVSGLGATVRTIDVKEGGQNLYTHKIPDGVTHENLVLERGMVVGSPLNLEFNAAVSLYKFMPSNVLITLFNERTLPLAAWLCVRAYPVRWQTSDLDASASEVVIDTMELAYARLQPLRV
ncbi:MAG: phage tail protein [Nannocystaceae bacterium]